jgi:hypothetical protein
VQRQWDTIRSGGVWSKCVFPSCPWSRH